MDQEAIRGLACDRGTTLLDRPVRRRMLAHIPMDDPARADVEDDEHIEDPKAGRDGDEEITREDRVRVIAYEGGPALWRINVSGCTTVSIERQFSHRDNRTSATRVAGSGRRGLVRRSR